MMKTTTRGKPIRELRPPVRPRCRGRGSARQAAPRGLMLAELLVALVITGFVGAVVAAMLFFTSYGTSNHAEMRSLLVSKEVLSRRLNWDMAPSQKVLAIGDNYLVLWMAETRVNAAPNLSELHRIERDPATNELRHYQTPADLSPVDDTLYDLATTDFNAVTEALKGGPNFPGELWATDVTSWTLTLNAAAPQQASFVGYRIGIILNGVSETAVSGAPLMNR